MQLFQSHLYGIERGLLHDNGLSGHGFNRTFMELKDICQLSVYVKSKFQSHLYGIESWQNKGRHSGDGVSIAPLWNWKGGAWPQSIASRWVSIAPLWNWKCRSSIAWNHHRCFNRTFMELKVNMSTMGDVAASFQSHLYGIESLCGDSTDAEQVKVSIAPLWNWKLKAPTTC